MSLSPIARDLVVGEALRRRRARIVEVVLVLDAVGGEERAPVVVHSELAVTEGGGMVFEEGLKEALALEELADLEEDALEVGVVVARPNERDAVCGGRGELVDDGVG